MTRLAWVLAALPVAAFAASVGSACSSSSPMAKIDAVKTALEKDDPAAITSAVGGYAPCTDATPVALLPTQASPRDVGCFAEIANALGSKKGFTWAPPDQAADATAVIVLMRDDRGDWLAHADNWLVSLKTGKGPGPDALRLAVARKMAEAAPIVGKHLEEENDQRAAMKAIAQALPGACPTYYLMGAGAASSSLAAEQTAEHSACVQHDLQRREGPGGSYGDGVVRALEGSLALWRETERTLRLGMPNTSETTKPVLDKKMQIIEKATQAIYTKRLATNSSSAATEAMGDIHAEAGIILWKDAGAGDGGVDAAAAAPHPVPLRPRP